MKTLSGKSAVVFGAGGSIGSAVARELATRGAGVFVSGRTLAKVEAVAEQIKAAGGRAYATQVDAEDDAAVNRYLDEVAEQAGRVDIVFNAIGPRTGDYDNGVLAIDLDVERFMVPLMTVMRSQFITARAAARRMSVERSGVIIFLTGSPARPHVPGATAIGAAFGAIENFMANLAFELGPVGVRSVCLRTTANTDSTTIQDVMDRMAQQMGGAREEMSKMIASYNVLKIPALVEDSAKGVAFLASDDARMLTCTVVNASAAAALD